MYKICEHEMVLCPYDRSHVVSKLRIQKHIIKCKDRHPEVKLITCFYNYTHKLKPGDILNHYEICSQKMRMEEARYCEIGYNNCKSEIHNISICDFKSSDKQSSFSAKKTNSIKSYDTEDSRFKSSASQNESENGEDNDIDELRPLNLPKTLSKAFTRAKPLTHKSSDSVPASDSESPPSGGLGRGRIFFLDPSKLKASCCLQQDVNDINSRSSKKVKSRSINFSNNVPEIGNSCGASVISSTFDANTFRSDDISFYDDEDSDGFIFKNFDTYIRI